MSHEIIFILDENLYKFFMFVSCKTLLTHSLDEVPERLRGWTANPVCSARVGSNPIFVANFLYFLTFINIMQNFLIMFFRRLAKNYQPKGKKGDEDDNE
jgi:hypothetical protein